MAQEFKKKKAKDPPSVALGIQLGRKPVTGTVGIEIEIEGTKLPHEEDTPPPWVYKVDHSLRGKDNGEYVLAKPLEFSGVEKALDTLWKRFEKFKTTFDDSNRTSVHVHLNCQGFFINRLTSFMALYIIVEEMLSQWCGDHRVGNLFCLRAKDAPGIVRQIKYFIQTDGANPLGEHLHYSAMNTHALAKYGSLEFRTLRGCSDPTIIRSWVRLLERLYNLSEQFPDPRDICGQFSAYGPTEFFVSVFGDTLPILMAGIDMSEAEVEAALMEGMRLAQELCYCRDWTKFKSLEVKKDPFGREGAQVANSIKKAMAEEGPILDPVNLGFAPMFDAPDMEEAEHWVPPIINNPFTDTWS